MEASCIRNPQLSRLRIGASTAGPQRKPEKALSGQLMCLPGLGSIQGACCLRTEVCC